MIDRIRFHAAAIPILACGLMIEPAAATQSVELFFTAHNGAPIAHTASLSVAPGDTIALEMIMTTDAQGVSAYGVSVDFDSADQGRITLDGFGNTLAPGFAGHFKDPFGPDNSLGTPGFVESFNAFAPLGEPNPLSESAQFAIGTLSFMVTAGILDGPAIIAPGLLNVTIDGILSNEFELIGDQFVFEDVSAEYTFLGATLQIIPEPSTAMLLGAGLGILSGIRRRH
jgi:hypothetical protein